MTTRTFYFLTFLVVLCHCAPRGKVKSTQPQTIYDQKQTGDYNIQLHLKDFQIIALLADDSIGGLGDYDYNYDYADFTIKPIGGSTTPKPPTPSESVTENTDKPQTIKPGNHPYPIISPSTSTKKPEVLPVNLTKPADPQSTTIASTTEQRKIDDTSSNNTPGKIKVQILETPVAPTVGIVPGEDIGGGQFFDNLPSGDILQYRRCSTGYARDKKGRCRRVRRPGAAVSPQLPFGISRLASNLAARFRYAPPESTLPLLSSPSSATEDLEK